MFKTLAVLAAFFSVSSHAITAYNCTLIAKAKQPYIYTGTYESKLLLMKGLSNKTNFLNQTFLDISVSENGKITGTVNGQPNFILKGTTKSGTFESAYHTGTITCTGAKEVEHVFNFIPWQQYFATAPGLTEGQIHTAVDASMINGGNVCFMGSAEAAAKDINATLNLNGTVLSYQEIALAPFPVTECVRYDDGYREEANCLEYRTYDARRVIRACNYEDESEYGHP